MPASTAAVRRAMLGVSVSFIGSGLLFATWVSRIPQVRDRLELSSGQLGLLLLALSAGALVGLPLAGVTVVRLGAQRAVTALSLVAAAGLIGVGVGYQVGVVAAAVGLFATGLGFGTWDVAMNVEGAAVEQRVGRSLLPRFHAGFSVGTVIGAVVGAALVALRVSVTAHFIVVGVVVGAMVVAAARGFLASAPAAPPRPGERRRHPLRAWTERRTLLVGVFVLASAFAEGTGDDWLGVAIIDGYGASAAVGSLSFAVFAVAMTTGRWFGPVVIDRWGRVPVLRTGGAVALVGLVVVVFGAWLPLAMVGIAAWGLGTSLGFPVGMSAAADDPVHAAARVSVVSSIGYSAFVAGPPVIGALGDHVGVLRSLTLAAGLVAVGLLVAGVCAEPERERAAALA